MALGVTDVVRSPALPDVPTLSESATFKGIDTKVWYAIFGPPGMPEAIVRTLADTTSAMLKDPPFREKLQAMMITPAQDSGAGALEAMRTGQLANFQRALGGAR